MVAWTVMVLGILLAVSIWVASRRAGGGGC